MSARFLVTGAAGFIGSQLCERLLSDGHLVRGVDRFSPYYAPAAKHANLARSGASSSFELVECDLADVDISGLVGDVDGVFHLAAQPGVRASWGEGFVDYVRDNVVATQRLFEAVCARPVPIVVASSSSVYGDADRLPVHEDEAGLRPVSPYGLTKLTVEHLARIYVDRRGLEVVALRYFTVYGPRQRPDMAFTRFVSHALASRTIRVLGDGEQSRDFSYVSDVVDATVRALGAPAGRVYNVGGGEPTSVNTVLATIEALLGRPIMISYESEALGDVRHTWANTTRARQELGWQPRTSLHDGLAAQLEWLRARDHNAADREPAGMSKAEAAWSMVAAP